MFQEKHKQIYSVEASDSFLFKFYFSFKKKNNKKVEE